jgi:GGDEF domain-containing protein
MHPLDQYKHEIATYLPGLLVLFDMADSKRRNGHLGHQVVDGDIEELDQRVGTSVAPLGLAKRVRGDKWLVLYKTDSLEPVAELLRAYRKEQKFLVGWTCSGEKNGESKMVERTASSTIVRSLRCVYCFVAVSDDSAALIEKLLQHGHRAPPDIPCALSDAANMERTGWSCVSSYPAEMPFCPFCEKTEFEWIDGDGNVYSGSGTCKFCGASIDIRGVERFPQ